MGLVLLLRGDEIAALTETEAVLRTISGARRSYRRKPATRSILLNAASCGSSHDGGRAGAGAHDIALLKIATRLTAAAEQDRSNIEALSPPKLQRR